MYLSLLYNLIEFIKHFSYLTLIYKKHLISKDYKKLNILKYAALQVHGNMFIYFNELERNYYLDNYSIFKKSFIILENSNFIIPRTYVTTTTTLEKILFHDVE